MEQIVIKKINNGDTGLVAANKIYTNEKSLKDAIKALSDLIESYGRLVGINAEVSDDGQIITISLEQNPGDSTVSVMSQNAVTEFVNDRVDGICKIGDVISGTTVNLPDSTESANLWVSRASSNAQGNSLTVMYNDVEELKRKNSVLETTVVSLQEQITALSQRVSRLEVNS